MAGIPTVSTTTRPWWLAAAIAAIGAFWIYGAFLLPQTSTYARIGPGLFVTIVGAGLIVLAAMLAVQIARGERFEPQEVEDADSHQSANMRALAVACAASAMPLYTMTRFGFVPTSALVFALTTMAFGSRRLPLDLAIGTLMGAIAFYGFSLLGVGLGVAARLPSAAELLPALKPF